MAFAFFGSASNIADEGTNAASPASVTPPGSMTTGDLVVMVGATKVNSTDFAMSTTGGQTWNDLGDFTTGVNRGMGAFWCVYNGTWAANPQMSVTVGNDFTVIMVVARPDAGETVAFDTNSATQSGTAPTTPFDVTLTGVTTATNDEFVICAVSANDDVQWVVQTGGFSNIQVDNLASTDMGAGIGHATFPTAGATGNITQRQTSGVPAVWIGFVAAWKATSTAVTNSIVTVGGQGMIQAIYPTATG